MFSCLTSGNVVAIAALVGDEPGDNGQCNGETSVDDRGRADQRDERLEKSGIRDLGLVMRRSARRAGMRAAKGLLDERNASITVSLARRAVRDGRSPVCLWGGRDDQA
jgi:hypothetical protein